MTKGKNSDRKQHLHALSREGKEENSEEQKMQDALSGAIVREKPNVKWTDVAGLDQAKSSL